jgi:DNA-binding transcriptional ArsR family regulator
MTARRDPRVALLKELADPLRLRVIDHLWQGGPASPSELSSRLGVPPPQVSNHLRRLRDAGLVRVDRRGRHAVYALADDGLEVLMPLLDRITGRVAPPPPAAGPLSPRELACTCYDHLAGRLGVALYGALRTRGAVAAHADGTVRLGPQATTVLPALGVDPDALRSDRRRFAFECLDALEHAPHLAGALGDAIAAALAGRSWIEREEGSRLVRVTPAGRRGLQRTLGLANELSARGATSP